MLERVLTLLRYNSISQPQQIPNRQKGQADYQQDHSKSSGNKKRKKKQSKAKRMLAQPVVVMLTMG